MADENTTTNWIDRRSVLKGLAAATVSTGALVSAGGSAAETIMVDAMADHPHGSVAVREGESCDAPRSDQVPNGVCGVYVINCSHDGHSYGYIEWYDESWSDGWVRGDHLSHCWNPSQSLDSTDQ